MFVSLVARELSLFSLLSLWSYLHPSHRGLQRVRSGEGAPCVYVPNDAPVRSPGKPDWCAHFAAAFPVLACHMYGARLFGSLGSWGPCT